MTNPGKDDAVEEILVYEVFLVGMTERASVSIPITIYLGDVERTDEEATPKILEAFQRLQNEFAVKAFEYALSKFGDDEIDDANPTSW